MNGREGLCATWNHAWPLKRRICLACGEKLMFTWVLVFRTTEDPSDSVTVDRSPTEVRNVPPSVGVLEAVTVPSPVRPDSGVQPQNTARHAITAAAAATKRSLRRGLSGALKASR